MVEGTAQRLDELRQLVSEKARAVIDSGVKVPREIHDLLTAEKDLTNYLEDRVRGQADALQAAERANETDGVETTEAALRRIAGELVTAEAALQAATDERDNWRELYRCAEDANVDARVALQRVRAEVEAYWYNGSTDPEALLGRVDSVVAALGVGVPGPVADPSTLSDPDLTDGERAAFLAPITGPPTEPTVKRCSHGNSPHCYPFCHDEEPGPVTSVRPTEGEAVRSDDEIRHDLTNTSRFDVKEGSVMLNPSVCLRLLNDVGPLLARAVGAEAERDAALAELFAAQAKIAAARELCDRAVRAYCQRLLDRLERIHARR